MPDASLRRARVGGACVMRLAGLHMLDHIIIINNKKAMRHPKNGGRPVHRFSEAPTRVKNVMDF